MCGSYKFTSLQLDNTLPDIANPYYLNRTRELQAASERPPLPFNLQNSLLIPSEPLLQPHPPCRPLLGWTLPNRPTA
jgi:hypothetical protein